MCSNQKQNGSKSRPVCNVKRIFSINTGNAIKILRGGGGEGDADNA